MRRHRARLEAVRAEIGAAKTSGAVSTRANVPVSVEERVARDLHLRPEEVSTQVVQRDQPATYVLELALMTSAADKMVTELRNRECGPLARTRYQQLLGGAGHPPRCLHDAAFDATDFLHTIDLAFHRLGLWSPVTDHLHELKLSGLRLA